MTTFDLDPNAPNQQFTVVEQGHAIDITLQTSGELCFATIIIDEKKVITSLRCVNNQPLIPYRAYTPRNIGNLFFYCSSEDYPSFLNFNTSCMLVYLTPDELKELGK